MRVALISGDGVVFGLVIGIPLLVAGLVVVWSRPRRWPIAWALLSLVAIAGTVVGAGVAFSNSPESSPAAVAPSVRTQGPPVGPGPGPGSPCSPTGTTLSVTAQGIAFSTDCLAAPAGQDFTIDFDNKDAGTPHNIHIFSANPAEDPNARSLFAGDLVTGPNTATYQVPGLPAGTYFFHCDVHPTQMFGALVSG